MKKILMSAAACAAALIVFLIYLKFEQGGQQRLSLWYVEEYISAAAMEDLAEGYAGQRGREACELSLRSFSSEEELAAAFEQEQPDLLMCSYARAASLGSRGLLGEVELAAGDYLPAIEEALPFAGRSFFPLGSRVPVLAYNPAVLDETGISPEFESFESFMDTAGEYREKTGAPFFSAESLSPLLCALCGSLGYELKGEPELDGMDEDFRYVYNYLASAAIEGSFLPPGEGRLELAAGGLLPCAVLDSPSSSGLPEGLSYAPLPLPKGGETVYVPEILGFAVTGANTYALPGVRDFALWLRDYFSAEDALELGLIPASPLSEAETSSGLDNILIESWHNSEAHVYPPLGDFFDNRRNMETLLGHALDLLY